MLSKMGPEYFDSYMEIKKADMIGQSDYLLEERTAVLDNIQQYHDEIMAEGNPLSIKDLALDGKDLKELGVKPGPEMGEILKTLLDKVLAKPELNTREELEKIVKTYTDN